MLGGSHDAPWPEAHRTTARCAVLAPDGLCQLQMCCPGSRCAAWAQMGLPSVPSQLQMCAPAVQPQIQVRVQPQIQVT